MNINGDTEMIRQAKAVGHAFRSCGHSAETAAEALRIIARMGPRIPHLNFYHRCKLWVCRRFGLSTDWIWEINKK